MQTLRWLRMSRDTLFAIGAIAFVVFIFGLGFGYSLEDKQRAPTGAADRLV
jgi:nitric oxide reductase large subunit